MNNSLVSIAMATYNGEKYLRDQLDSIYSQSYKNIEVIACDDCSSDKTVEILKEYNERFGLQYFINEKNLGYTKNFEKAISFCQGEYIALSDQDDIWLPEKIQVLISNIGENNVIHSDAYLIDESGIVFSSSFTKFSKKMINPTSEIDMILNGCVTGCTCMVKKNFIDQILPFPDELHLHDKFIGFASFIENKLIYINHSLIKYRQHPSNNIGAINVNISFVDKFFRFINKNNKNALSKFICEYSKEKKFCEIVLNRFSNNLSQPDEIKKLCYFYGNIISLKKSCSTINSYVLFFDSIEKNKPLKYRLFMLIRFIINILQLKIMGIKSSDIFS